MDVHLDTPYLVARPDYDLLNSALPYTAQASFSNNIFLKSLGQCNIALTWFCFHRVHPDVCSYTNTLNSMNSITPSPGATVSLLRRPSYVAQREGKGQLGNPYSVLD
jgi:hypothetical protein